MIRKRVLLKSIAILFIFEMVVNIVAPTVSWALTAGPTAPETTSFEPVDTTDLVNIATGDLAYNIPLIEVPGPGGGYPLSLSYHSGIQPNEEASWVGWGWTLNPGAINRGVNGYADDFNNKETIGRTFWEGGESKSIGIGVSYSSSGSAGVGAGLSYSEDTYGGYGVSFQSNFGGFSHGMLYTDNGVNPDFTNTYGVSVMHLGTPNQGLGIGLQISNSLSKTGTTVEPQTNVTGSGSSILTKHSQGASLNSLGLGDDYVNAAKQFYNYTDKSSKQGKLSTHDWGFTATIPIKGFVINIGAKTKRYWINDVQQTKVNGSLNFPSLLQIPNLDNRGYDTYDLNNGYGLKPEEQMIGAYIDYDSYNVLGQGIGGSMRPYHYKAYIYRENKKDDNGRYRVKSLPFGFNARRPEFRFVGDFSNRHLYEHNESDFNEPNWTTLDFTFNNSRVTGKNGNDGYDNTNDILPGSKDVKWFKNSEILDKPTYDANGNLTHDPAASSAYKNGFVDSKSLGLNRSNDEQIGGFRITNATGISYHYGVPVYSYGEGSYSGRVDHEGKHLFNDHRNPSKYAYTWLLSAVTGPDYVDTNENGYADSGDYGYWVSFEYGKWTGMYNWRNPGEGFDKDIDQTFNIFSKGSKQLYYLNAIKTQTHTAIFEKVIRKDGKGVVHELDEVVKTNSSKSVADIDDGGFTSKMRAYNLEPPTVITAMTSPVSVLKLKSVYIFQNSDISNYSDISAEISSLTNTYHQIDDYTSQHPAMKLEYHLGNNVIDSVDMNSIRATLDQKALKKITLEHDYSLCNNTVNSFVSRVDVKNTSLTATESVKSGRLTLKTLRTYVRGGASLLPPTRFNYDLKQSFTGRISQDTNGNLIVTSVEFDDFEFKKGDIFRFSNMDQTKYAFVTDVDTENKKLVVKRLGGGSVGLSTASTVFHRTKNPPYHREFYDSWGLYKVDYADLGNENASRMTSSVSQNALDVWSLRDVTTPLGAKIKFDYEPDQYKNALKPSATVPIKSLSKSGQIVTVELYEKVSEYGLNVGNGVNLTALTRLKYVLHENFGHMPFNCGFGAFNENFRWDYQHTPSSRAIQTISGNKFTIEWLNIIEPSTMVPPATRGCLFVNKADVTNADHYSRGPDDTFACSTESEFVGGELHFQKLFSPYGGGIRVNRVSVETPGEKRSTLYSYFDGVTTYEPGGHAVPIQRLPGTVNECVRNNETAAIAHYREESFVKKKFNDYISLFANAREIPAPGVLYGKVQVREELTHHGQVVAMEGYNEFEFENFSPERNININNFIKNKFLIRDRFNNSDFGTYVGPYAYTGPDFNMVEGLKVSSAKAYPQSIIEDFSALYGNLKRSTAFDKDGRKLTETVNHYLHDDLTTQNDNYSDLLNGFNNQGVITETFVDRRILLRGKAEAVEESTYEIAGIASQRKYYPSVLKKTTTKNFKTGLEITSETLGFDFYSGKKNKTSATNGYGSTFITETISAYEKYDGMKQRAFGGRNMLAQNAATFTYKLDPINGNGLVSASVQTWSDQIDVLKPGQNPSQPGYQPSIWRKHAVYAFVGDNNIESSGLFPMIGNAMPAFNSWIDVRHGNEAEPSGWMRTGEATLFDVYSNTLEAKDVNGRSVASKMNLENSRVFASVVNAEYKEFAYSGAEETPTTDHRFGGGVVCGQGGMSSNAHTGSNAVTALASGTATQRRGFTYAFIYPKQKTYRVSLWSSNDQAKIKYKFDNSYNPENTATVVNRGSSGGWFLLEADIPITDLYARIEIWCESNGVDTRFDDFRVCPLDAPMTSYVYNQWGEVTHILNSNNLFTEYRYDATGRVKEVFVESLQYPVQKVAESKYHFNNQE